MKNKIKNSKLFFTVIIFIFFVGIQSAMAQAPPPPGVPIDFGISGVVALCIGYGAYRKSR